MPSEITWLPSAVKDVGRLRQFLTSKNPVAAHRAATRIIDGVNILRENPSAGVPVAELTEYHDLTLTFGSGEYIIRYRQEFERIVIVRVRHSKEDGF